MSDKVNVADLPKFDMASYLSDEQATADYLNIILEEDDPAALADALGTIARAKGMTDIANASGLGRESLYKALQPGTQPRFETIQRVCAALGVKIAAEPMHTPQG